jgi:integrase
MNEVKITQEEKKKRLSLTPISDKEGLYIGIKRDGKSYTVRKDRSRYFRPSEWNKFIESLTNTKTILLFDTLIQIGARIDEALHIRPRDYNFDQRIITLYVTKSKARKGETATLGGKPRSFGISSQYVRRVKKYLKDNNINERDDKPLFNISQQGVYQLMRRKLKDIGIEDWYNFSLHNIRKTHGMWLKTLQSRARDLDISEICQRLGHDYNTFLKHYGSPSIFTDQDRDKMVDILGDVYNLR